MWRLPCRFEKSFSKLSGNQGLINVILRQIPENKRTFPVLWEGCNLEGRLFSLSCSLLEGHGLNVRLDFLCLVLAFGLLPSVVSARFATNISGSSVCPIIRVRWVHQGGKKKKKKEEEEEEEEKKKKKKCKYFNGPSVYQISLIWLQ